jgi:5-methyltetrahydropteroyltriglutamate--homocysteine methyltransferase
MVCAGPIKYKGHAQLNADLDALKLAVKGVNAVEAFVPAIAPSNVETTTPNEYYKTAEEYVFAIAAAMREEYKAIVDAGLKAVDLGIFRTTRAVPPCARV